METARYLCATAWLFLWKSFFLYPDWTSLVSIYISCLSSSHCAPLCRASCHLLDKIHSFMRQLLLGSLKPSLFQAEQAPFPQTLFICQVLQAPHHLGGPLLKVVRLFECLYCTGGPKLDAVFQLWSKEDWVEEDNHFSRSAGCLTVDTALVQLAFAARVHWQLIFICVRKTPSSVLSAELFPSQAVLLQEAFPSQVQDFPFALVEFHEVPVGPILQPMRVPLSDSPALEHVVCSPSLMSPAILWANTPLLLPGHWQRC